MTAFVKYYREPSLETLCGFSMSRNVLCNIILNCYEHIRTNTYYSMNIRSSFTVCTCDEDRSMWPRWLRKCISSMYTSPPPCSLSRYTQTRSTRTLHISLLDSRYSLSCCSSFTAAIHIHVFCVQSSLLW